MILWLLRAVWWLLGELWGFVWGSLLDTLLGAIWEGMKYVGRALRGGWPVRHQQTAAKSEPPAV